MALSYVSYSAPGGTTDFTITYPYIAEDYVKVYLDGTLKTVTTDYTFFNATTIRFNSPVSVGVIVLLKRQTLETARVVDFQDAGNLTEADLDNSADQVFHLYQEHEDTVEDLLMQLNATNDWDAESHRIINVSDPIAAQDAVTKNYVDTNWPANSVELADTTDVANGDALVGLKRTLTGAVASTLHDYHESRFINVVVDFGADNTGVGDASAAIQAAIDSITTGVIFVPQGSYLINTGLVGKAGVELIGAGPGITVLMAGTNGITVYEVEQITATDFFYVVKNMSIVANSKTTITAIDIHGTTSSIRCSNVTLEDLYISAVATGITIEFCANTKLLQIHMAATTAGYLQTDCADTDLAMVQIQNGTGIGFEFIGSRPATAYDEGVRMNNCSTNGQYTGIKATDMDFMNLATCSFTTAEDGPAIFIDCTQIQITTSEFASVDNTTVGMSIDGDCELFNISNCNFLLSAGGITMDGQYHCLTGNIFHANYSGSSDLLISNAVKCAVTGNQMNSTAVSFGFLESGTADWNSFSNNVSEKSQIVGGGNSVQQGGLVY